MYNWSVDEKAFKKASPEKYEIWRLEQMIHYGKPGEKIPSKLVKKYWDKLSLDPGYRAYLEFLLWPKKGKLFRGKKTIFCKRSSKTQKRNF